MTDKTIDLKFGVSGHLKLEASKNDENGNTISSRVVADWFHNIITNNGLDWLAGATGSNTIISGCVVGSGNTPEQPTDNVLASYVAGTVTKQVGGATTSQVAAQPYYLSYKITYRFGTGVAAGNLSEVGIVGNSTTATSATPLFSRALIRDAGGVPTTITILADETLDVTYEFRVYPPNGGSDITGTFIWNVDTVDTTFNYTLRPGGLANTSYGLGGLWPINPGGQVFFIATNNTSNFASYGGVSTAGLAPATSNSLTTTGTNSPWSSVSSSSYTLGNYYRDFTYNLDLNTGNLAIATLVTCFGACTFQWAITPTLNKTNVKTFTWTVRLSWGRYTP